MMLPKFGISSFSGNIATYLSHLKLPTYWPGAQLTTGWPKPKRFRQTVQYFLALGSFTFHKHFHNFTRQAELTWQPSIASPVAGNLPTPQIIFKMAPAEFVNIFGRGHMLSWRWMMKRGDCSLVPWLQDCCVPCTGFYRMKQTSVFLLPFQTCMKFTCPWRMFSSLSSLHVASILKFRLLRHASRPVYASSAGRPDWHGGNACQCCGPHGANGGSYCCFRHGQRGRILWWKRTNQDYSWPCDSF